MKKLPRAFYLQNGVELSQALLGKILVHSTPEGVTRGRIVETEAYMGERDAAAHSYKRLVSGRTSVQYGPGGFAYVYLIYGIHSCMNVVANREGIPEVALLRALEPLEGLGLMARRRRTDRKEALCSGPGKLCMAMGITRSQYGLDLCGEKLWIEDDGARPEIAVGKRIGIDYAGEARDYPWRFAVKGSGYLSAKI